MIEYTLKDEETLEENEEQYSPEDIADNDEPEFEVEP
jgi:hypothetical protein